MELRKIARVVMVAVLMLLPRTGWAQDTTSGAIAGVVKDASGAVLPGVTVEAASPALIDKVRTVVTDEQGLYKVVDLRPGVYSVTFTLPGFSSVKREGIELTTGFTAPVNADLRVGSVEETITVTGASPVVDTQNTRQQAVLTREILDSVPTGKATPGYAALIPGISVSGSQRSVDVGGSAGEGTIAMAIHGGRGGDERIQLDGMGVATMIGTGGGTSRHYTFNQAAAQEIVLQTGSQSAEAETGGILLNMVPKDGGNLFKGTFEADNTNSSLQGDNLSDSLVARGLRAAPEIKKIWAARGGLGGPIKKDRLWFYTSHGRWNAESTIPGNYFNKLQGTLFYEPDLNRPAYIAYPAQEHGVRVNWQMSSKNRLNVYHSNERGVCQCYFRADFGVFRPEAAGDLFYSPLYVTQATWTHPASNRLLFEAGFSGLVNYGGYRPVKETSRTDRAVIDLADGWGYGSGSSFAQGGFSPLTEYSSGPGSGRGANNTSHNDTRFAASYITGSHALKFGGSTISGLQLTVADPNYPEVYQFRSRVPVSIIQMAVPYRVESRMRVNLGLYGQDQWTFKKLTLNLGLRFQNLDTYIPEQVFPGGAYVSSFNFAEISDVVNWKDFSPRVGASYDVFGNGKTAIKATWGRYINAESLSITDGIASSRLVTSATRTWNDTFFPVGDPRRGNYVPDCDLRSTGANNECGALSDANFGRVVRSTQYDDSVTHGWGVRPFSRQLNASIQHEVRPGFGATVAYFRTSYYNLRATDNRTLAPGDYDPFCITTPVDSRIPGGGGKQLCGLYDLKPARFGLAADNLITGAENFGKPTEVYNGIDGTISARFGRGGMLAGGFNTGRTVVDNCFTIDSPQTQLFCKVTTPFAGQTQLKLNGVYPLPWGIQASGVFQNVPGPTILASYVATNAEIRGSLGRDLAACRGAATCAATVTVPNLFEPNTAFEKRRTQLDLRLAKIIRAGKARVAGRLDVYNVFNANSILAITSRYSPTNSWLQPSQVLPARFFKFGVQIDF